MTVNWQGEAFTAEKPGCVLSSEIISVWWPTLQQVTKQIEVVNAHVDHIGAQAGPAELHRIDLSVTDAGLQRFERWIEPLAHSRKHPLIVENMQVLGANNNRLLDQNATREPIEFSVNVVMSRDRRGDDHVGVAAKTVQTNAAVDERIVVVPRHAHLGQMLAVDAAHLSVADDQDAWQRAISSSCSECNRLELTQHTSRSPNKPPDGNSGRLPI